MNRRAVIRALALSLVTALLVLVVAGCGGDPYSGKWQSTALFNDGSGKLSRNTLVIAKSGDDWTVTDALGRTFTCRKTGHGLLEVTGPSGSPIAKGEVLQRAGNELVLGSGAAEMRYTRQ
jgi:hypothetical protein